MLWLTQVWQWSPVDEELWVGGKWWLEHEDVVDADDVGDLEENNGGKELGKGEEEQVVWEVDVDGSDGEGLMVVEQE